MTIHHHVNVVQAYTERNKHFVLQSINQSIYLHSNQNVVTQ